MELSKVTGAKGPDIGAFYPTHELIEYWFDNINKTVFNGRLQPFSNIHIRCVRGGWGACDDYGTNHTCDLIMNPKFPDFTKFLIVLSHEMVHLDQWQQEGIIDHGRSFYSRREELEQHNIPLKRNS